MIEGLIFALCVGFAAGIVIWWIRKVREADGPDVTDIPDYPVYPPDNESYARLPVLKNLSDQLESIIEWVGSANGYITLDPGTWSTMVAELKGYYGEYDVKNPLLVGFENCGNFYVTMGSPRQDIDNVRTVAYFNGFDGGAAYVLRPEEEEVEVDLVIEPVDGGAEVGLGNAGGAGEEEEAPGGLESGVESPIYLVDDKEWGSGVWILDTNGKVYPLSAQGPGGQAPVRPGNPGIPGRGEADPEPQATGNRSHHSGEVVLA